MLGTYRILYDQPKYGDYAKGLALPLFIHNGSYFLVTLDIYTDGVVNCWGLIPITSLQAKVESGWVTTEPPIGGRISIHDLGAATLSEVEWQLPKAKIIPTAQDLFRELNSDNNNVFNLDERSKRLATEWNTSENHVGQSRMRSNYGVYRLRENSELIAGASIPIFWASTDGITLTYCFIYADKRISIGYETNLYSIDEVRTLFDEDRIRTSVEDNVWITVPGLGRFKATKSHWYVKKEELLKNILNCLNVLSGQLDVVAICYQAFVTYGENPTDANREKLRIAYEAVPEHHRLYTQRDMDDKDHTIRDILYRRNEGLH